jgi:hypothetical protein
MEDQQRGKRRIGRAQALIVRYLRLLTESAV